VDLLTEKRKKKTLLMNVVSCQPTKRRIIVESYPLLLLILVAKVLALGDSVVERDTGLLRKEKEDAEEEVFIISNHPIPSVLFFSFSLAPHPLLYPIHTTPTCPNPNHYKPLFSSTSTFNNGYSSFQRYSSPSQRPLIFVVDNDNDRDWDCTPLK
jgi:hypothetical protein